MEPTRILVTGSTDGIGLETACRLAEQGHSVIVHGRSEEKAVDAREAVRGRASQKAPGAGAAGGVETVIGDLSSLKQVDAMAREVNDRFPDLRVVLANAGVTTKSRRESADGYELTFAVNHLAHFLLINRLVDTLKANAPSRIVIVSSMVHRSGQIHFDDLQLTRGFSGHEAYSQSKLANLMFAFELARRLEGSGVTANGLHPGVISTKLLHVNFSGGAPVSAGAKTPVYLATSDDVENVTGKYFENRRETTPAKASQDEGAAKRLWDISEELVEAAVNK
jgi:NAD(P)-dependent dehydrogenase (short-subunit alcohol dehydrogenase family)